MTWLLHWVLIRILSLSANCRGDLYSLSGTQELEDKLITKNTNNYYIAELIQEITKVSRIIVNNSQPAKRRKINVLPTQAMDFALLITVIKDLYKLLLINVTACKISPA